jgi:stage IV sporulation protein FB
MPNLRLKTTLAALVTLGLLILASGNIPAFLLLLAALAVHEWSHLLTGECCGYQKPEFALTMWGGQLTLDASLTANAEAEYLIALSGPLANWLMVGGVCYLNWLGFNHPYLVAWYQVNFLLGSINLLPALPLDGGRIIHAWLNRHLGLSKAAFVSKRVTLATAVLLAEGGVVLLLHRQGGALPLLTGCYLLYHLAVNNRPQFNVTWQLLQHKKKLLAKRGLLSTRTVRVAPETLLRDALRTYGTHDYLLFYLLDRQQNGWLVSEELAWQALIAKGSATTFLETIKAGFSVNLQKLNR